ncbi:MAG TPA: glycerophosphodiester phosphodiesterase [Terriglobales bacterium]|nr:glycerophosphodiester phosphodiesterase [Terriglobales bacterium]
MSPTMPAPPLLLGHRGARDIRYLEENSLQSFDFALRAGCDGFEFDVRMSRDKRAVIVHDTRWYGLTVASSTFSQLLAAKPRPPGKTKVSRRSSGPVSLDQVLQHYQRRVFLDIELKVTGIETTVLEALRQYPPQEQFVISSFLPAVLWEIKARSHSPTGLICDRKTQLSQWSRIPGEYVMVEHKLATRQLIDELHAAARRVFVWTVNTPARMRRFADWRVDGIISDDPELLVKTLRNPGSARS